MSGSRFSSRTLARSQALQLLFQAQATGSLVSDVLAREYVTTGDPNEAEELVVIDGQLDPYARELALGADGMLHELDSVIGDASTNWTVDRMPSVDRNLLRLAVYEMAMVDEVDKAVSINEFVELAKAYGTDESARFVNGVLGRVSSMLDKDKDLLLRFVADECDSGEVDEGGDSDLEPTGPLLDESIAEAGSSDLPAWAQEG